MLQLTPGTISSFNRGDSAGGVARAYAATRGNVEAAPVTPAEAPAQARSRRPGERRRKRRLIDDPHIGTNVDIEV